MDEQERGLKEFDIAVASRPAELGDYLDEAPTVDIAPPPPMVMAMAAGAAAAPVAAPARKPGIPRKQLNMSPETQRMLDELLDHIRSNSMERDIRASELFHALVLAVHEARPYMDLSSVPARGRWGSTQAAELPVALKNVFQNAIARGKRR